MARKRRTSRRSSRGRGGSRGFNQKLVMDAAIAGTLVRLVPILVNKFYPLSPTLYTVAGIGGGWLGGKLFKKPDVSNLAIGFGAVELVAPMLEGIVGGVGTSPMLPVGVKVSPTKQINKQMVGAPMLSDFVSLNEYVSIPTARSNRDYANSY